MNAFLKVSKFKLNNFVSWSLHNRVLFDSVNAVSQFYLRFYFCGWSESTDTFENEFDSAEIQNLNLKLSKPLDVTLKNK